MKRLLLVLFAAFLLFSGCDAKDQDQAEINNEQTSVYCDDEFTVLISRTENRCSVPVTIKYNGTQEWILSYKLCIKVINSQGEDITADGVEAKSLNAVLNCGDCVMGTVYFNQPEIGENSVKICIAKDLCSGDWAEFEIKLAD